MVMMRFYYVNNGYTAELKSLLLRLSFTELDVNSVQIL
jgi:hypothetical protein